MTADEFEKFAYANAKMDYGVCTPPISAEVGMDILIRHFLGDDWYSMLPISREQLYTEAIYEILRKNPRYDIAKNSIFKFIKRRK